MIFLELINNFLICLTGLPASGKTTFAKLLKKNIMEQQNKFEVKIIDPDVIRSVIIEGAFDPEKESLVRKQNLKAIEKNLKKKKIVISDDINYYTSMRHELKQISQRLGVCFFMVHISTPLEICLEWNAKRGKPIPNQVILNISEKFDTFEKYKWETPDLILDLSKAENLDHIVGKFLDYIAKQLKIISKKRKKEKSSKTTKKEYEELLDSLTRSLASDVLKTALTKDQKKKILKKRKEFLKENLDKELTKEEIKQKFRKFLNQTLNIGNI